MDLWRLSAVELRDGYASRVFSPVEVVREAFERIERLNPLLNAFLACNVEEAMAAATVAEKAWLADGEKPPLCGIPVSVKDTIEMRGLATTYGSVAFKDNQRDDAEVVRRLRAGGAVILGKTNTPEFALHTTVVNRLAEPGRNPWNLDCTCGGSSGGAAAGVAAGLGPIAIGTDSAGSVRLPAAYTGVFGLKPSFQRIPDVQVWLPSPGRGHIGPITRTVADAALAMAALAGPDDRDADSLLADADYRGFLERDVEGARIAVSTSLGEDSPLPEGAHDAIGKARTILKQLGCSLADSDPPIVARPEVLESGVWAYAGEHYSAAEALVPDFWRRHQADLTDYARPIIAAGARALAWQYRQILQRNADYRERFRTWFQSHDYLICPAAGPAPSLRAMETRSDSTLHPDDVRFLATFNHAHAPAAVVPIDLTGEGLPIAIQIVGHEGDDVGVLRIAACIEASVRFADAWPGVATS